MKEVSIKKKTKLEDVLGEVGVKNKREQKKKTNN